MRLKWLPQPDITTLELAQCMGILIAANQSKYSSAAMDKAFENLPANAKRHFDVVVVD